MICLVSESLFLFKLRVAIADADWFNREKSKNLLI
jgi:hypothetical protein